MHGTRTKINTTCSDYVPIGKKEEKVKRNVSTYRCRAPIIPSKESMVVFFATGALLAEDAGIASTSRVILNYCCRHTITGSGWFQKINTGISIESSINPKECAYSIRPVKRDKNEPSKIIYYPFDKNMPSTPQRK